MIKKGQLQKINAGRHRLIHIRYQPLEIADLTQLKENEKDVIDRVIELMIDWSEAMISQNSHKDLHLEVREEDKEISLNLVFYRQPPYSVRVFNQDEND